MKFLSMLLIAISLASCTSVVPVVRERDVIAEVANKYVNQITMETGGHCSSITVDVKGKIRHLTAGHCCYEPVYLKSNKLEVLKLDKGNDVCELSFNEDFTRTSGMKIAEKEAEITDISHVIGFPLDNELSITSGRISKGRRRGLLETIVIRTNAHTYPGNSGGAVVNSKGELVGILSQTTYLNDGLFIPVAIVLDIIQ